MTNRKLFVKTVWVKSDMSVARQLRGLLKGQWVNVNGMMARVVNNVGNAVVLWMKSDAMVAVFP